MSMKLNISEQSKLSIKMTYQSFLHVKKFRGQKFFVHVLWLFKKRKRFARTVLWRVRKPIGNVNFIDRTVKRLYFN